MPEITHTSKRAKRICVITSYATSLDLFNRGIFENLRDNGWEIVGISAPDPAKSIQNVRDRGFKVVTIPFVRQPAPLRDLCCLIRLWWFFLWNRFDLIHSSTPKAMLIGTLAAFFSGHRNRVITFRGRAYENSAGLKRKLFIWLDKLTVGLARSVVCVSASLRQAMLADGIGPQEKLIVFGKGSSKGIDAEEFSRQKVSAEAIAKFRSQLGLGESENLVLFVGRVRQDKGINELIRAFLSIIGDFPAWHLLIVGETEPVGEIFPDVLKALQGHPNIHEVGTMASPRVAYAASDIVVLPTWREGFPNVSLEAAAMELPVITTNATGAVDSVEDGRTGLIVEVRNSESLALAMRQLIETPLQRKAMGQEGRKRVLRDFRPEQIQKSLLDLFQEIGAR